MKKKIGILTWHYYPNFGSALQAFALQKVISGMGHDVRIVDYENPKYGKATLKQRIKKEILRLMPFTPHLLHGPLAFRTKYMRETRLVQDDAGVARLCKGFDFIVYGSDQIWAPNVFNPIYMGAHTGERQKKVSYAASIGLDYIPDALVPQYKDYLSRFSSISVREKKAKELLRQVCGLSSEIVLDPTLLIECNVYDGMAKPVSQLSTLRSAQRDACGARRSKNSQLSTGRLQSSYVFCYFLNANHSYKNQVSQFAQRKNCKIVGVSANSNDQEWMQLCQDLGSDEFLWLVKNALTVFTDSYHGTIFSLLFHKNFWVFPRFHSDDPICQNSRIEQLNDYFDIAGHIVKGEEEVADDRFDYSGFENRLNELRMASLSFLKKSLE